MGRNESSPLKGYASIGALLAWALGSTFTVVIWGVRLDSRLETLEHSQIDQNKRLDQMDAEGTRKLQLVEERQREVIRRIDGNVDHMNNIDRQLASIQDAIARLQRELGDKTKPKL